MNRSPLAPQLLLLLTLFSPSIEVDTITPATPLIDGQTLISSSGTFELGFFSLSNATFRYLGIWYKNIPVQTIVWVANGADPLTNSNGVLKISSNGNLVLLDGASNIFWSSSSTTTSINPAAQLLDSGNLVLKGEESSDNYLWESFDYPSDTLLAGMKLGWNLRTGLDRYLTSWTSDDDPSPGDFTFKMDPRGSPEIFLYKGSQIVYRSGPWNGLQFSGVPDLLSSAVLTFTVVSNQNEFYYTYELNNDTVVSRFLLNNSGVLQRYVWLDTNQAWSLFWYDPRDECDSYGLCGPYGVCNSNTSPVCNCLPGFKPKQPAEWKLWDGSSGCVRTVSLDCPMGDGFLLVNAVKLPDTGMATVNESMSLDDCRQVCLNNCSCMAYASANISGAGSGCIMWATDLIDLRLFAVGGQDLYVRLAASEISNESMDLTGKISDKKKVVIVITVSIVSLLLLLGIGGCCIWKKKAKVHTKMTSLPSFKEGSWRRLNVVSSAKDLLLYEDRNHGKDLELPLFDFVTISDATNSFASSNKLGEGGFGPVYKGILRDGQEIAVKRLSENSSQGLDEFKNEVKLIAKLQHRNLVRLLGYCIHGEEWMLIYEFMHNRSLDTFIFDKAKSTLLDWQRRFTIILGIARGLLYLHQDSRLKIIHRDLKASNVLLDIDMNPKISDFGMARIFGGEQADAQTQRVVGTFGYMSPEYAMDGIFSVKSDVFSFGVLILEILSGKRNKGVFQAEPELNLLCYAWRVWKDVNLLELIDESMGCSYTISEVMICVQVGLLCVQEQAIHRPTMTEVITMLSGKNVTLPEPNMPAFSIRKSVRDVESISSTTVNGLTVTMLHGR